MKLDYDPLAPTYDQRYAASPMHSTGLSLLALAGKTPSGRILEAGCGTGHWLSELASHGYAIFGLDFSAGMLDQARASGALRTRGDAVHLPFAPGVFQLVFCVNALHHLGTHPGLFRRQPIVWHRAASWRSSPATRTMPAKRGSCTIIFLVFGRMIWCASIPANPSWNGWYRQVYRSSLRKLPSRLTSQKTADRSWLTHFSRNMPAPSSPC